MKDVNTEDALVEAVRRLKVWRRGDVRAPHKPLLVLLALGRFSKGFERLTAFSEIEGPLRKLLIHFGPPRRSVHPEYPFWRLSADHLWDIEPAEGLTRRASNSDPLKSDLLAHGVCGGFSEPVWQILQSKPQLISTLTAILLENSFPASLHDDILREVGLDLCNDAPRRRDSKFQSEVLRAYGHRCAICGYDVKIDNCDLGLEGAHIKWHQAGGPDDVCNGMALCTIHHRALDRGAIGVTEDSSLLLSSDLHGSSICVWFEPFKGKAIASPSRSEWIPKREYFLWHLNQVFRGPAIE